MKYVPKLDKSEEFIHENIVIKQELGYIRICWTSSPQVNVFKRIKTGLNTEFSFS